MSGKTASASDERERVRYDLYQELDLLEELLEDMIAVGVRTVEEAEARIEALNVAIDALEATVDGK